MKDLDLSTMKGIVQLSEVNYGHAPQDENCQFWFYFSLDMKSQTKTSVLHEDTEFWFGFTKQR